MDNQHRMIAGYRELSQEEIDLMNAIKAHAALTQELHVRIEAHLNQQRNATALTRNTEGEVIDSPEREITKRDEQFRIARAEPLRWLAIGKTHAQESNMAFVRAVAQPSTF